MAGMPTLRQPAAVINCQLVNEMMMMIFTITEKYYQTKTRENCALKSSPLMPTANTKWHSNAVCFFAFVCRTGL
jgi:hypothetical protein